VPDILGTLRAADGAGVVHIERRYPTSPADVWSAITDPHRLARWYGWVEGDLRPGGEIRVHLEGADLDSVGRIEVCKAPRRLVVTTRETDESRRRGRGGEPFVQTNDATLTPDREGTTLVLEIRGLPLSEVGAYGAGWQIHTESLAAHLSGSDSLDAGALWADLLDPYAAMAAALR